MIRRAFKVVLISCFSTALLAQQAMDNNSILKLCKAGLSDDLIVSTINATPGNYDTSADGLIALKSGGATDKVVSAVLNKASTESKSAAIAETPTANNGPTPAPEPASAGAADSPGEGVSSGSGPIRAGARVVIAPMGGFETYFAAAVREKKVPISLTVSKASAQYFVISTNTEWEGFVYGSGGSASWSNTGGHAAYGSAASSTRGLEASIMVLDAKTKDVVWAYEVHKSSHGALLFGTLAARGQQSLAEACAKHLKEYIEKGK